jgi:hypothetical protein
MIHGQQNIKFASISVYVCNKCIKECPVYYKIISSHLTGKNTWLFTAVRYHGLVISNGELTRAEQGS